MDTAGCQQGSYTDEILLLPGRASTCGSQVTLWLGLSVTFLILRAAIIVPQVQEANVKRSLKKARGVTYRGHRYVGFRIPLFLVEQTLCIFTQFIFVLLTSLNVANSQNGVSYFIFGITIILISTGHMLLARSIVRLGRKIIPLSEKRLDGNSGSLQGLDKLDWTLKFFTLIGSLCIALSAAFFMAMIGVDDKNWVFRVGFYGIALYQFFITASVVYQYHRCITAIHKIIDGSSSDGVGLQVSTVPGSEQSNSRPIHNAIKALTFQQGVIILAGTSLFCSSILIGTLVVPIESWVWVIYFLASDTVLHGGLLFPKVIGRKNRNLVPKVERNADGLVVNDPGSVQGMSSKQVTSAL